MPNAFNTVDLGEINNEYLNDLSWENIGANESVHSVPLDSNNIYDDLPELEPDTSSSDEENNQRNLLTFDQLASLFWDTPAEIDERSQVPVIRRPGRGSVIRIGRGRYIQETSHSRANSPSEIRDSDEIRIVYERINSSSSRRRRHEENSRSGSRRRRRSNEFTLTAEDIAREKLLTQRWINKVMPSLFMDNHPRHTNWVFLKHWIFSKARYSRKIALIMKHTTVESRLKTFEYFPKNVKISTQELAEAGLFYLGYGTSCLCFCCQGLISDWKEGDDVWKTHVYYYPECGFAILSKGGAYIRDVHFEKRMPLFKKIQEAKDLNKNFELQKASGFTLACPGCLKEGDKSGESTLCPDCIKKDRELHELIQQRAKRTEEDHLCVICLDKKVCILLIPCSHISCCSDCVLALEHCAICRTKIQATMKVYFS